MWKKKKKDKTLIGNKRSFNDVVQELPKAAKTTLKDKKPQKQQKTEEKPQKEKEQKRKEKPAKEQKKDEKPKK